MKHYPARIDIMPNQPIRLVALCGYESANEKDFIAWVNNPDPQRVTCEACRQYDKLEVK